jgi:DNA-binding NtrC family response regulator
MILRQNGMTGIAAYSGASALRITQFIPPDLLLTYIVMPKQNGFELALAIKSLIPTCKIILISGYPATLELLADAEALGDNIAILQKPVSPTDLIALVARACNLKTTGIEVSI